MEIPLMWQCDEPAKIKDRKVGKVTSYDPETHEITAVLDEEHAEYIRRILTEGLAISMSCRAESAKPNKKI